ncbi:NAD(P)H-dependent oxidoreductase [Undibacterium jejuense]|uniref:NAD(P)H-dependent oxidoreductase n=1 Tax=Undibacterium jejuense TaxID=1344949 RepID=A0A923HM85_9BURK|nr:NAD(P)H-dependent oxidoreductase [Undibacterium jejuense]MBC3863494.1 NAD(P)H-dependent oxidoreductase [Undibacterium jejuense]
MGTAIILGTSRPQGNTHQLAMYVADRIAATLFNLADHDIAQYDYEHKNRHDDFLPLIKQVLGFDRILLASPVYWYAPSGIMKIFLDRLSDLVTIEKELGRALRNKQGGLLATGCDVILPSCFEQIFELTYQHLGARYLGMLYCPCNDQIDIGANKTTFDTFIGSLHVG